MRRRVALDANLAVLLVVGNVDRSAIARHKRLQSFDRRDYDLLVLALSGFDRIVCTPNVLTEVSNLLRQISEPWRTRFTVALAVLVSEIDELYVASREIVVRPAFHRLGLTDVGLLSLSSGGSHLLTSDATLANVVGRAGLPVTDFNHLRAAAYK